VELLRKLFPFTRRTNFDDSNFSNTTFNTLPSDSTIEIAPDTVDYYKVPFILDDTRAINQSIRSTGPYKIEIQNMPSGDYDIQVVLILQTAGYEDYGSDVKVFTKRVIGSLSREYLDIIFTETKLEDYLSIDPSGLWTCNRVLNHYGKLMVYGSSVNPQTVYIGDPTVTEYFPDFFTLDFETDDEQEIQKITPWMNILVVQGESFTWGLKGVQSFTNVENAYTPFAINPIYGTIAPKSVRPVRNQLYFLSREGIVSLNSIYANDNQYNIRRLDENIENIVPLDKDAVAIQYDNQYWIHFPNSPNNMTLRYYIDNKSWVKDTYFEYNGLDANGNPQLSSVVFNGIYKYIRKDGDLFMITNPMRRNPTANLRVFKLKIDESIPTDLGEAPRTLFETAYMNQNMPFHPKKYLEQRFDFTIQNEFNLARKGEIYREEGVTPSNLFYTLADLPNLQPNHTYRVQVDRTQPLLTGQVLDPVTNSLIPVFADISFGINVSLKKDGQVIGSEIAPLSQTATPALIDDFSSSNQIFFKVLNNDDDNIDVYYDLDLATKGKDPNIPNNYEFVIKDIGSRNITDELFVTVDNLSDGSVHRLYVLAISRDDLPSTPLDEAYTLSSISIPPIIDEVAEEDITNTTVSIGWSDENTPESSSFRIRWFNLDTGAAVGADGNVSGNSDSYVITGLVAGNDYRIYIQAEFDGRFSPERFVDVETTTGLETPEITNITGTTTATVTYTDPNQEQEETSVLLQFQQDNLAVTNSAPTPQTEPANSTSAVVTLPLPHTLYKFRVRAVDAVTDELSEWSDFRQFVFAPAPGALTIGENTLSSFEVEYPNYITATEYEFRYKLQSDPDIEENWTTITKTYAQALADNFVLEVTGLPEGISYNVEYRLKFIVNTVDQFSAERTSIVVSTDSSVPLTETPSVTTFSTTDSSITLRVTNNDPVAVAVLANQGDVDPTTSRGTINSQNGTLNVTFSSLPSPLSQYTFSVAARASDNSKLKSNKVLYTESTSATTTPAPTTTAAPTQPPTQPPTQAPTQPPSCPSAGIVLNQYCSGTTLIRFKADGNCGTYRDDIQNASVCLPTQAPTDPPPPDPPPTDPPTTQPPGCPPAGTFLYSYTGPWGEQCLVYANGSCGEVTICEF